MILEIVGLSRWARGEVDMSITDLEMKGSDRSSDDYSTYCTLLPDTVIYTSKSGMITFN